MKRLDFLKEMRNSFLTTVKAVSEPFLEEKADQVEKATDKLLGIKWTYLCREDEIPTTMEQKFLEAQPVVIIREEEKIRTFSGICPVCSNLLVLSTPYTTLKCFLCDKDYNFKNLTGELSLTELPMRKEKQDYYIGIKKKNQ